MPPSAPEPVPARLGWRPALDGLRGVAVLLVMLFHFQTRSLVPGGFVGVDLFFVLSGFLITSLLCEEWQARGHISLRHFYARRALRLLPAVVPVLVLVIAVALLVMEPGSEQRPSGAACLWTLAASAGYVLNWVIATGGDHVPSLVHLWSLSVEEQYYLLWPGLLVLLLRCGLGARALLGCTLGLAMLSASLSLVFPLWDWPRLYYGSDFRAQALLLGSALAQARSAGLLPAQAVRSTAFRVGGAFAVAGLVAAAATAQLQTPWLYAGGFTGIALAACAVVVLAVEVEPGDALSRALCNRPLVYLGQRSYALYLWHLPIADWLYLLQFDRLDQLVMGFALTLGAAELSYRLVERPALRLKALLRPPRPTGPTPSSPGPVQGPAVGGLRPLGGAVPR